MKWKKEIARDIIALGSLPFYLIVIARALIGPYMEFFYQLTIALAIIYLISIFIKSDSYSGRSLVLLIFTSLFYEDRIYTLFASILWILVLVSSNYLKTKRRNIASAILIGAIASAISYWLTRLIV